MSGPSLAWALAGSAIANANGTIPLPAGISTATIGHWKLRLNNSKHEAEGIPPFGIEAQSDKYLAVATFDPSGGVIGGYSEDQFIEDMRPHADPALAEVQP